MFHFITLFNYPWGTEQYRSVCSLYLISYCLLRLSFIPKELEPFLCVKLLECSPNNWCFFWILFEGFLHMKMIVICYIFWCLYFFLSFKIMLPRTYQISWVLISNSIFLLACIRMRLTFKNNFENYPKFWLRIYVFRALLVKQMCSECQTYTGNTKASSRTDDIRETSYVTNNVVWCDKEDKASSCFSVVVRRRRCLVKEL